MGNQMSNDLFKDLCNGMFKVRTIEELGIPMGKWREIQFKNKSFRLMEAYKCTKKLDCMDFLGKDFDYFNKAEVADAYGREIAVRLSSIYKDKIVFDIFGMVVKDNIDDEYSKKVINIYKYFKIDEEVMKHFYCALYDTLCGNEDDE